MERPEALASSDAKPLTPLSAGAYPIKLVQPFIRLNRKPRA